MISKVTNYLISCFINRLRRKSTADYLWSIRGKAINSKYKCIQSIYEYRYNKLLIVAGAYIPINATFLARPVFPHWVYGIFISQGAIIGFGCTIFHQVTIGSNTLSDSKTMGAPTIGNNVYIGCGAKIIGKVKIGDNVRIGANCVITQDVPDNSTVVLEKPRIIEHKNMRNNVFNIYKS